MPFVTFNHNGGRTGNILFQYLMCKLISLKFDHTYICKTEFIEDTCMIVNEENIDSVLKGEYKDICSTDIIVIGYFQKSDLFMDDREQLLQIIYDDTNRDYWNINNHKTCIRDFITAKHSISLNETDIVLSLRLDDFIQLPCESSDIIPPSVYLSILNSIDMNNKRLFIVCDKLSMDWEFKYVKHFDKYNPILIQNSLLHDCALMIDCNTLIHSNSTLCWLMSFLSKNKTKRYIINTNFYRGQLLKKIDFNDELFNVKPLLHSEVYNLKTSYTNIFPMPYCIPDECIVQTIQEKTQLMASLIPGNSSTYIFDNTQENEYNEMYRNARFAVTTAKGGWDCLRHYEILANGCIPVFDNIHMCPTHTLTSFPKELIMKTNNLFSNWQNTEKDNNEYNKISTEMLEYTKNNCSSSANAKYFFDVLNKNKNLNKTSFKNILLITCHPGVNYSRELLWIGIKRQIQSSGGIAVEYPKIDYLYKEYESSSTLYGNGFTYSKRLNNDYNFSDSEMIEKIKNKCWDLVIFGKVGPDELELGTIPKLPLWDVVKDHYGPNEIVFLYGGDGQQNMRTTNKYSNHLLYHSLFGTCFVRELLI